MIGYITLGTNDLARAKAFYTSVLEDFNVHMAYQTDKLVAWKFEGTPTMLILTTPYDQQDACHGNGTMVALTATSTEMVDRVHAKALKHGATDEGPPGPRGQSFYGAYLRDLDGNKLNIHILT